MSALVYTNPEQPKSPLPIEPVQTATFGTPIRFDEIHVTCDRAGQPDALKVGAFLFNEHKQIIGKVEEIRPEGDDKIVIVAGIYTRYE